MLPLPTVYFVWKRVGVASALWLALLFGRGRVRQRLRFQMRSDTEKLTALHLPIALWLAVGVAYVRSRWFAGGGRMDSCGSRASWRSTTCSSRSAVAC